MDVGKWIKVLQFGGVCIGDDCEIGVNICVDCGVLEDIVLDEDVCLDNLVQIVYNVQIGVYLVIVGCIGIVGSVKIGCYCLFGGYVGVVGYFEICDKVVIIGKLVVCNFIYELGEYLFGILLIDNCMWCKNVVCFKQLDVLVCCVLVVGKEKE